jgi:hypothetical protein
MVTDPQRPPGRIIGLAKPLADFKDNISQGDVVSKAVEDLGWAVKEVVLRPFAGRRHAEMIECLNELREACLQEDEIDAWNRCVCVFTVRCMILFWKQHSAQTKVGVYEGTRKPRLLGRSEEKQNRSDNCVRSNETWRQVKHPRFVGGGGETPSWRTFSLLTLSSSGQPNLMAVRKIDTQC